jgi:hypothetical protein
MSAAQSIRHALSGSMFDRISPPNRPMISN